MINLLAALTIGQRIDLIVKDINAWDPVVWLIVSGTALYFTYKELKDYTKNGEPKIQEIADILDEKSFEKSTMPLMIQLDAQVVEYARTNYDEALEANGEPFDDPIAKYEEIRATSLQDMDISAVSQALELTDSLKEAARASHKKAMCDRLYRLIRTLLKVGFVTLILNLLAGFGLLITSIAFTDNHSSRYAFVIWGALLLINLLLGLIYAIANITIDGYRRRK